MADDFGGVGNDPSVSSGSGAGSSDGGTNVLSGVNWGGMLSGLGSALGGVFGYKGQGDTNKTNIALAQKQQDFQERMSSTAYQRAVKDMQAAGINPMLASQVGGASTPSGAMPTVLNKLGAGVAGAQQGAAVGSGVQQAMTNQATMENIQATTAKIKSETMQRDMNVLSLVQDIEARRAGASLASQQQLTEVGRGASAYAAAKVAEATVDAEIDKKRAEASASVFGLSKEKAYSDFYDSKAGKLEPYLGLGSDVISSALRLRTLGRH